ncbi:MAG: oligopeptide transporter, OPT family [Pirellulales bacterium]|nr:oligopeptide transporter, OPT family [Pirellulales bacterium]
METGSPKKSSKLLPSNAYTKLAPGEEYKPIVPAEDLRAEVTPWSVTVGLLMVVVFSAACVFMALRAGNAIEASIPIAIMAIFFGRRGIKPGGKSTILENVIVQSIGQAAGVVAAGSAFLIPALYINQLEAQWWEIFLACVVGGFLGVVLIIPLRKYFVKDLHGDLPFPEATAINEILVSGEGTSKSAGKVLLAAFGLGAAFDFLVEGVRAWNPGITSKTLLGGFGEKMSNLRMDLSVDGTAALFGLGYIIGLRYAAVIAAGSVFAGFVLVPLVYEFGTHIPELTYAGKTHEIAIMSSGEIFKAFVHPIGIGAIAVSGIIGIIRMGNIVLGSVSLGFKGLKSGKVEAAPRTQTDMAPRNVLFIQFGSTILMGLLFFVVCRSNPNMGYSVSESLVFAAVGAVVGFALSFLFTPVAAQAIAIVGVNPVSGMTLITVVLTILALVATGLSGKAGIFIAVIVGCAVCTALSTSGALISDFKIGYWIGSTPRKQEVWKFLGIVVAALVVAFVIPLMDSAYNFLIPGTTTSNTDVLPAPQANLIAAVAKGLLEDRANQPWLLYGLGGSVAIMLYMAGVPMLAFSLGMYISMPINMAVLAGAFVSYLIGKTGGSEKVRQARRSQGILIASGLMAGAAIFGGIVPAILRQPGLSAPIQHISVGEEFKLLQRGSEEEKKMKEEEEKEKKEKEEAKRAKAGLKKKKPEDANKAKAPDKNKEGDDKEKTVDKKPEAASGKEGGVSKQPDAADKKGKADTKEGDAEAKEGAWYLKGKEKEWFEGERGQRIGLAMLIGLALACFLLAKVGADWALREEDEAERAELPPG